MLRGGCWRLGLRRSIPWRASQGPSLLLYALLEQVDGKTKGLLCVKCTIFGPRAQAQGDPHSPRAADRSGVVPPSSSELCTLCKTRFKGNKEPLASVFGKTRHTEHIQVGHRITERGVERGSTHPRLTPHGSWSKEKETVDSNISLLAAKDV